MKKLFICFMVLFCYNSKLMPQIDFESIINHSVVKISVELPNGKFKSIGTGFFVRDFETIITANHINIQSQRIMNNIRGGKLVAQKYSRNSEKSFTVPIKLVQWSYKYDLSEFKINVDDISKQWPEFEIIPLQIDDRKPKAGDEAVFIGYWSGRKFPFIIKGIVSGFADVTNNPSIKEIFFDKISNPGQSGSPLVSMKNKHLIGMTISVLSVTEKKTKQAGLTRAVISSSIREFLGQ